MSLINNILIPFDCIMDEDVGLFGVIREKYSNDTVFYMDRIKDVESMKELVLDKKYENPLELILRPEYLNKKDDFYNQFIEQEYRRILELSVPTKLFTFASKTINNKVGNISFFTKNDTEIEALHVLFKEEFFVDEASKYEELNVKNYDIIFLKRYTDSLKINKLEGKSIYLLDYNFNLENNRTDKDMIPNVLVSLKVCENNVLNLVSVF